MTGEELRLSMNAIIKRDIQAYLDRAALTPLSKREKAIAQIASMVASSTTIQALTPGWNEDTCEN